MGWFEDNFGAMGDLMPMNPSPRTFLSSITNEDCPVSEPGVENKSGPLFSGFEGQGRSENGNQYDHSRGSAEGDEENSSNVISETKMSSRGGGLMERIAARAGFNAPRLNTESIRPADLSKNPEIRSPYLTIPSGLSPTTLLDSPVFLTNSMVLPSPTTGKFSFAPSGNSRNSTLMREDRDICKENAFEDASTFAFKPLSESGANPSFNVPSKVNPSGSSPQPFPTFGVSNHSDISLLQHGVEPPKFNHGVEPPKFNSHNDSSLVEQAHFSKSHAEINSGCNFSPEQTHHSVVAENSPPLDEPHDDDDGLDQRSSGDPNIGGAPAEDGYNWRKYGQKLVKGSEYPRSYYKCTHPNCPVKKKVEQSQEGQVTIVYKGTHDHPKPPPNRRLGLGPSNTPGDSEQAVTVANGDPVWLNVQKGENLETTSLTPLGQEYGNGAQSQYEARDTVNRSSTCSNEEEEDHAAHGSASLGNDGEEDESESKRRRIETYALDMGGATRAIREPRVVVQTTSEVDILDDGYRWRKYGQKVVKGNPNPRSYYKCTSPGCNVRKHVERACHDLKSVITTYEGKHNHDVPAARNSSHASSVGSNINQPPAPPPPANSAVSSYISGPEPSQISTARVERPPLGPFGLPGRPQIGPGPGFGFRMNHPGLAASLGLAGLVNNQGKLPTLPVHPYLGHHQTQSMNGMGFMLPKPEPKLEPVTDSGLNTSDGSSVYQQLTIRLPLGPQM